MNKLTNVVRPNSHTSSDEGARQFHLNDETVALLQALPDSASLHYANGNAVWVSEKSTVTFKQSFDHLIDKGYLKDINPQDKLLVLKAFSDCRNTYEEQTVVFRCQFPSKDKCPDLSQFELRLSMFEFKGESLILAVVRDVTQEQKALLVANQDAEKANSSNNTKSLFLSNMSHELRTPLNAIIGFSQMLSGEGALVISEEKKSEYAELINQSATHLLNIINDILDASKIEAGKFQIIPELMDASEILQATLKLMAPIADEAGIQVSTDISPELPNISADPRAVRQILINLIANAIKFSYEGAKVHVQLTRDRRKLRLKVSDTGLGMGAETLEKLGNSFFQAEQTSTKGFEGTGLGLSIVFGLIKLHKGNITFDSKPGEGTTVCVELPILNENSVPIPADPNEGIVFLNEVKEPNLMRRLTINPTIRKTG